VWRWPSLAAWRCLLPVRRACCGGVTGHLLPAGRGCARLPPRTRCQCCRQRYWTSARTWRRFRRGRAARGSGWCRARRGSAGPRLRCHRRGVPWGGLTFTPPQPRHISPAPLPSRCCSAILRHWPVRGGYGKPDMEDHGSQADRDRLLWNRFIAEMATGHLCQRMSGRPIRRGRAKGSLRLGVLEDGRLRRAARQKQSDGVRARSSTPRGPSHADRTPGAGGAVAGAKRERAGVVACGPRRAERTWDDTVWPAALRRLGSAHRPYAVPARRG
jgi:hypothetical protein